MFRRCCDMIGRPDMRTDPRFANDMLRGQNSIDISQAIGAWCATKTRDEALEALARAKLPSGPIYAPREALEDAQIQAANLLPLRHFEGMAQAFPVAPHPVDMSDTQPEYRMSAPVLGQHTDEILQSLGFKTSEIASLKAQKVV